MGSSILHPSLSQLIRFANSPAAQKFVDVIVVVTNDQGRPLRRFEAHKLMLAAHSNFFARIFATCCTSTDDPTIVLLPQAELSHVQTAIDFIYGRNNSQAWKEKNDDELAGAARLMGIVKSSSPQGNSFFRESRKNAPVGNGENVRLDGKDSDDEETRVRSNTSFYYCCNRTFDSELYYASHKEYVHLESPDDNTTLFCCNEKISGTFRVHLESNHHLNEKTATAECCDITFNSVEQLTDHCAVSHGMKVSKFEHVRCCSVQITNFGSNISDRTSSQSKKQGRRATNKTGVTERKKRDKSDKTYSKPNEETSVSKADSFSCTTCNQSFRLKSSLRSHLYRLGEKHDPTNKSYPCDGCDEIFNTVTGKRNHMRQVHFGKNDLSCTDCGKSFAAKHRLNEHLKAIHLQQKDLQCVFCGKMFASKERLRIHEKFAHLEEEIQVECDICRKTFRNKERMRDHRRSVHRTRNHHCDQCGLSFKNSSTLKSHIASVHTASQEQPLQCPICGRGFQHKSRLEAHMVTHSKEAKFQCRFCGRPNKSKNNNNKHEKICKYKKKDDAPNFEATNAANAVLDQEARGERLLKETFSEGDVNVGNVINIEMNNIPSIGMESVTTVDLDTALAKVPDVNLSCEHLM